MIHKFCNAFYIFITSFTWPFSLFCPGWFTSTWNLKKKMRFIIFFIFYQKEKSLLKLHVKSYVKFLGFAILGNNSITNWLKIRTWKSERRMKIVIFLEIILNITILQKFDETYFFSFLAKLFQEATFLIIIFTYLK